MTEHTTILRSRVFHTGGTVAMGQGAEHKSVTDNAEFQERMQPLLDKSARGLKDLLGVDVEYSHSFVAAEDSSNLRLFNVNDMHRTVMETQHETDFGVTLIGTDTTRDVGPLLHYAFLDPGVAYKSSLLIPDIMSGSQLSLSEDVITDAGNNIQTAILYGALCYQRGIADIGYGFNFAGWAGNLVRKKSPTDIDGFEHVSNDLPAIARIQAEAGLIKFTDGFNLLNRVDPEARDTIKRLGAPSKIIPPYVLKDVGKRFQHLGILTVSTDPDIIKEAFSNSKNLAIAFQMRGAGNLADDFWKVVNECVKKYKIPCFVHSEYDGYALNPGVYDQGAEVMPYVTTVPVMSVFEMEARLGRVLSFCVQSGITNPDTLNNLMTMSLHEDFARGTSSEYIAELKKPESSGFAKRMTAASQKWVTHQASQMRASM